MVEYRKLISFGHVFFMLGIVILHTGAILKKEDNALKITGTESISYQQKLEQEKDGVKAPAATTIEYYGGKDFFEADPHHKKDYDAEIEKSQSSEDDFLDWWDSFEAETDASSSEEKSNGSSSPESADDVFDDFLDEAQEDAEFDDDFWW